MTLNKNSTSKYLQEEGMSVNQPIETQEQKTAWAETFNMVSSSKVWELECRQWRTNAQSYKHTRHSQNGNFGQRALSSN